MDEYVIEAGFPEWDTGPILQDTYIVFTSVYNIRI